MTYDPNAAPDAGQWLTLSEDERLHLVSSYYESVGSRSADLKVHAAVQAVAETYLAMGVAAASRALDRLLAEGLTRHEATRAIGNVLESFSEELTVGPRPEFNRRMYAALDSLSAVQWKTSAGGASEG